ncbi:MAG: peptidylprolyl isomerase [Myxococcota bacterium]|nr:peptidylprolyl isomerase [Myxococcota bacterium]
MAIINKKIINIKTAYMLCACGRQRFKDITTMHFWLLLLFSCNPPEPKQLITEAELVPNQFEPNPPSFVTPQRVKARHILISHQNALDAPKTLRRTRSASRELAENLKKEIENGAAFKKMSVQYGDDPTANFGGGLGVFGRNQMMKPFEELVFQLEVGELGLCETIYGHHVVERLPLEEVRLRHLIVQWNAIPDTEQERTKEEAKERIQEAHQKLLEGNDPVEVIASFSDGPMKKRGGEAGWFQRHQLGTQLRDPAFNLAKGEVSTPIESAMGYHILIREE